MAHGPSMSSRFGHFYTLTVPADVVSSEDTDKKKRRRAALEGDVWRAQPVQLAAAFLRRGFLAGVSVSAAFVAAGAAFLRRALGFLAGSSAAGAWTLSPARSTRAISAMSALSP